MKKDTGFDNGLKLFLNLFFEPAKEVYLGYKKNVIPWLYISIAWGVFNTMHATNLTTYLLSQVGLSFFIPTSFVSHSAFIGTLWLLPVYFWGIFRMMLRRKLTIRLTELFTTANLKTATGKLPSLIFDQPIDEWTRKLRLKKMNLPKESFTGAKSYIESGLHVYVDDIRENRESGTIDFIYSHHEMPRFVPLKDMQMKAEGEFLLGETRARSIKGNFAEIPHILIGGQTGGGKSTFLRQLITSVYISNPEYSFYLIDLKGGLEFQLFEQLPRVQVIPNVKRAVETLRTLEKILEFRFQVLKANNSKDLSAYFNKPIADRIYPDSVPQFYRKIHRTITVIDEAAELFMAGNLSKSTEVQEARRLAGKIAAQGRAVGLHLIIATQKPDVKAIDSHIKINLTGIISFQMPNLGSSMSILSSGRAVDLPAIPGRAIWKCGLDQLEIQTPYISAEETEKVLSSYRMASLNNLEPMEHE